MNIIILTKNDEAKKNIYQLSDERFIHIKNILKSKVGDLIEVGLLNGPLGTSKIVKINSTDLLLEIVEWNTKKSNAIKVDIICALPRPQTLKKVLAISATMGVNNLYLIRSEKVEKSYFHTPLLKDKNYKRFLIEGLSQGKRTQLPIVSIHKKFQDFFQTTFTEICDSSICLLADTNANNYLSDSELSKDLNIILAIGPEGGWNEYEIQFMRKLGFKNYKLSESILRVENAVTAALSQVEILMNQKKKTNH